jgi:ABC-2 type transport system ATP-binding protein
LLRRIDWCDSERESIILEVEHLVKRYGELTAVDIDSLRIAQGESFGLVGNNGAGKTTLFSLVLDLIAPTAGRIRSRGVEVFRSEHWKTYTGAYLDEKFLIEFLTPAEYFDFVGGLSRVDGDVARELVPRFGAFLGEELLEGKKLIRELSKGNQKKVGITAALMTHPALVVLDEPFPHLDPTSVVRLKKILAGLRADPTVTVLISSHDLSHVTEVCDRIAVLDRGRIARDLWTDETTLRELEKYFAVETE